MSEVGFEFSIIFFRMEVAACMWQNATAEAKLQMIHRQIEKIKIIFVSVWVCVCVCNKYMIIKEIVDICAKRTLPHRWRIKMFNFNSSNSVKGTLSLFV
jgi:hypothetical protein